MAGTILLRGTLGPGPLIGRRFRNVIRTADREGHEIGLHAWDHHRWQTHVAHMSRVEIRQELRRGVETLTGILGRSVTCFAAPGWRSTTTVLEEQRELGLTYHSDCRGHGIFRSLAPRRTTDHPDSGHSADLRRVDRAPRCRGGELQRAPPPPDRAGTSQCTHGACRSGGYRLCPICSLRFIETAKHRGIAFVPLGQLLPDGGNAPCGVMAQGAVEGRDGWVTVQAG